MKKILLALLVVSLTACVSVPVERRFPSVPAELMTQCPDLRLVPEGETRISAVLGTVVDNYSQYRECQLTTSSWQEWYTTQKNIFDSVK